jgi:hypothetical protein
VTHHPKQEEEQMATRSKKAKAAGRKPPKTRLKVTDPSQYITLRTLLDSAEIGALVYYLDAATGADKNKHFDELRQALMPLIHLVWPSLPKAGSRKGKPHPEEPPCPPGYNECDGCCVPYLCPN